MFITYKILIITKMTKAQFSATVLSYIFLNFNLIVSTTLLRCNRYAKSCTCLMYTDFMSLEVNIYLGTINHHLSHKHRGLVNKG